jgi:hypothetical protein
MMAEGSELSHRSWSQPLQFADEVAHESVASTSLRKLRRPLRGLAGPEAPQKVTRDVRTGADSI